MLDSLEDNDQDFEESDDNMGTEEVPGMHFITIFFYNTQFLIIQQVITLVF